MKTLAIVDKFHYFWDIAGIFVCGHQEVLCIICLIPLVFDSICLRDCCVRLIDTSSYTVLHHVFPFHSNVVSKLELHSPSVFYLFISSRDFTENTTFSVQVSHDFIPDPNTPVLSLRRLPGS